MVDPGPKPHVGGPILPPCFPRVLIGNLPSARTTDKALCIGPVDTIVTGSPTVHIGGRKLCARIGDKTAHGGVIVQGLPTVLVGNGTFPFAISQLPSGDIKVGNHLIVKGTPEFQATVLADLATIAQTPASADGRRPAGLQTLSNLDAGRHDVTIVETSRGNACAYGNATDAQNPAVGSGSEVRYNPNREPPTHADPTVNRPADVGLHHELSHSDHMSQGTVDLSPATNPNNPHVEEQNTINQDNLYRDDRGIPRRADHTTL